MGGTVPTPAAEAAEVGKAVEISNVLDVGVGDAENDDEEADADSDTHVDSNDGSKDKYSEVGDSPDDDFNGHVVDPHDNDEGPSDENKVDDAQAGLGRADTGNESNLRKVEADELEGIDVDGSPSKPGAEEVGDLDMNGRAGGDDGNAEMTGT